MARDSFTKQTIETLAKRVAYRCSHPECRILTSGPHSDPGKSVNIGVAAHITAASPGGPRYDKSLSSAERKSPENGIWLCQNHAHLIDIHEDRYPVELLHKWKHQAEIETEAQVGSASPQQQARVVIPELPPNFIERSEEFAAVREGLLASAGPRILGLLGMGGIGKTVLASALAHDPGVRGRFKDRVFWVTVGQNPKLVQLQSLLCERLDTAAGFTSIQEGKDRLRETIEDEDCLLILDDVWQAEAIRAFNVVGQRGRVLITTRDGTVITGLGADEYRLDVLSDDQAEQLLRKWSRQIGEWSDDAMAVARECGNLPLALKICGAMVRDRVPWSDLKDALREGELTFLEATEVSQRGVFQALNASVNSLTADERDRYLELAVFHTNGPIPEAPILNLWESTGCLSQRTARRFLGKLERKCLLSSVEVGTREILLHNLQHDYLRKKHGEASTDLHSTLVDSYHQMCSEGWSSGPDDGYFFEHLPYHLSKANRVEDLQKLLRDIRWLAAKVIATDVLAVLSDYELRVPDEDNNVIREALSDAKAILTQDALQLPTQLIGRLRNVDRPAIKQLVSTDPRTLKRPSLFLLSASLTPPKRARVRCSVGHSGSVTAVKLTPDGSGLLSAARDRTIKIWDTATSNVLKDIEVGHSVSAIAVSSDCKLFATASECGAQLWDLRSAEPLRSFTHDGASDIKITMDNRRLVSASKDRVRVWDLINGGVLHDWERRPANVTKVVTTSDSKYLVFDEAESGSGTVGESLQVRHLDSGIPQSKRDQMYPGISDFAVDDDSRTVVATPWSGRSEFETTSVEVWELTTGKHKQTLRNGHHVASIAITPGADLVIAGGKVPSGPAGHESTIKVWNAGTGDLLCTLEAHINPIIGLLVTHDGQCAISIDSRWVDWSQHGDSHCPPPPVICRPHSFTPYSSVEQAKANGAQVYGSVRVWDLSSLALIASFHGEEDFSCVDTSRGDVVAAGSLNGAVHVLKLIR